MMLRDWHKILACPGQNRAMKKAAREAIWMIRNGYMVYDHDGMPLSAVVANQQDNSRA